MPFIQKHKYSRAWSVTASDHFLTTATGQRAYVFDRITNNQLAFFDKLSYAYSTHITPDEKTLIVRGTTPHIWFFSLETMHLIKKIKFKGDQTQGQGSVLSLDGRCFYYIVYDENLLTYLAKIDLDSYSVVGKYFTDSRYVINTIQSIPEQGRYLMTGYERPDNYDQPENSNRHFIMWFDGVEVLKQIWVENDIWRVQYAHSEESIYTLPFSGNSINVLDSEGQMKNILDLHLKKKGHVRHMYYDERTKDFVYDPERKMIFLATSIALYAIEVATGEIVSSIFEEYGFARVGIIDQEIVAIHYGGGASVYHFM